MIDAPATEQLWASITTQYPWWLNFCFFESYISIKDNDGNIKTMKNLKDPLKIGLTYNLDLYLDSYLEDLRS